MINVEELKKMMETSKESIRNLMVSHDQIMNKLKEHDPGKFEQIAKDAHDIRKAKTIDEINKIMNKYADYNNK